MAKELGPPLTKRKTLEELIAEDARSPIPTLQQPPALSPVKSISKNFFCSINFKTIWEFLVKNRFLAQITSQ